MRETVFAQGSGGPENHHLQIPDVEAGRETMPRGIPIACSFIHSFEPRGIYGMLWSVIRDGALTVIRIDSARPSGLQGAHD